jgi:hypothetical protein
LSFTLETAQLPHIQNKLKGGTQKNGAASKRTNKRNIAKAKRCDKTNHSEQGFQFI